MRAGFLQTAGPSDIARLVKARAQLNNSSDLFPGIGCFDKGFDNWRITTCAVQRNLDRQHLWVARRGLDPLNYLIEAIVRMMKQHILASQYLKKINVRRKRRIASRLKWPVLQLGKRIIGHERHQVRHGKWAVEFVSISLGQVEEPQQQLQNILWTIRLHLQPDGVSATCASQL